jgi:hypothetical protein
VTDTAVDTVPAAQDNAPMMAHIVCGTCHPVVLMGDRVALCGAALLGIPNPTGPFCKKCDELQEQHILTVHRNMWGR